MVYTPIDDSDLESEVSSETIHDYPATKPRYKLQVFPDTLEYSASRVNDETSPQPIILINTGFDPVTISDLQVVGDFILKGDIPESIQPGDALSILISCFPKRVGPFTGGVYINTGDAAGTEFIKLEGTGLTATTNDLLSQIIRAKNDGNGSAVTIQATTLDQIPLGDGKSVIALNITHESVGATQVIFNNNPALTIKKIDGTDIDAGFLTVNSVHIGYILGSTFRLLTDATLANALALLTQYRDDAEIFRDGAEAAQIDVANKFSRFVSGSATEVNIGTLQPGETGSVINVSVTGVVLGDLVLGVGAEVDSLGVTFRGYVSGTDMVKVYPYNNSNVPVTLEDITVNVQVLRA